MSKEEKIILEEICKECKVREGDESIKKLFKCKYCREFFCKEHVDPKLVFLKSVLEKARNYEDVELLNKFYEDWRKKDGHPCYPYTIKFLEDHERKKEEYKEKLNKILEKPKESKYNNNYNYDDYMHNDYAYTQETPKRKSSILSNILILFLVLILLIIGIFTIFQFLKN